MAAIGAVDAVILFDEPTPLELIMAIKPDVLVKGGDWEISSIVGAPFVLERGGEVLSIPLVPDSSTTGLVEM
ncbi:rfaE bifunctional protein, partial [mine drainage metagenome]